MNLRIRDARPADAEIIAEFNARMALETEGKRLDPETVCRGTRELFNRPELGRYFVAEDDGSSAAEIVGQCMVTYEWSDWRAGAFWWFQSVYVPPDHRGSGVFRALFAHVESLARSARDVCGLRLYVERHNTGAIATYERLGMVYSGHSVYEMDWSVR